MATNYSSYHRTIKLRHNLQYDSRDSREKPLVPGSWMDWLALLRVACCHTADGLLSLLLSLTGPAAAAGFRGLL